MLLSLHGLPRTPGTPLTHRTLRTPRTPGTPWTPRGIPSEGFSGLQRVRANWSSGSQMRRRLFRFPSRSRPGWRAVLAQGGHIQATASPQPRLSPLFRRGQRLYQLRVGRSLPQMRCAPPSPYSGMRHLGQRKRRRARRGWRLHQLRNGRRPARSAASRIWAFGIRPERPNPGPSARAV